MRHEKILVREDKTRLKIVAYNYDHYGDMAYRFELYICSPNKRKWTSLFSTDDFTWRKLNAASKKMYELSKYLQYVTKDEILSCVKELWQKMEPDYNIFEVK